MTPIWKKFPPFHCGFFPNRALSLRQKAGFLTCAVVFAFPLAEWLSEEDRCLRLQLREQFRIFTGFPFNRLHGGGTFHGANITTTVKWH